MVIFMKKYVNTLNINMVYHFRPIRFFNRTLGQRWQLYWAFYFTPSVRKLYFQSLHRVGILHLIYALEQFWTATVNKIEEIILPKMKNLKIPLRVRGKE